MTSFPLTEAQHGLWLARRLDPENPIQNTGQAVRFRGAFALDLFADCLTRVLEEADGLRVRVDERNDPPRLVADAAAAPRIEVIDAGAEASAERTAWAHIRRDMASPRDPTRDPMVTQLLFRLGPEDHLWYQCIQHLVIDGYGTTLLNTRILDCFEAARAGDDPRTRPLRSFADVAAEDAAYRASDRREQDRAFWHRELADLREVRSLADGVPLSGHFHHRAEAVVPDEVRRLLEASAAGAGATWPDAVVALVAAYLRRHLGDAEVVVGVPVMNRLGSASARVPAMVMNVLPVRVPIDETQPTAALIAAVAENLRHARRHAGYRSEVLRRDLDLVGEGRRLFGPLVNILPFQPLPRLSDLEMELEVLGAGPVDDLTITFRGGGIGDHVNLELDANPELYTLRDVQAHRDRLLQFLARAGAAPATLVAVPTLTDAEHEHWVREVNDSDHPVEETTLVDLMEDIFDEHAESPALEGEQVSLSYAELDRDSSVLAGYLAARGIGAGDVVAVLLPRSVEQVVAFVAILRSGAAYLPLDPEHPVERQATILREARPAAVLTAPDYRCSLPDDAAVLEGWRGADVAAPTVSPRPDDAAYVIFTSGSTGTPKGVVVEHRAIVNRLRWMATAYGFDATDRTLHKTPATFDVSVWELFLPLTTGGTLVVAPPGAQRNPAWLARLLREQAISAVHFVPSMLAPFLEDPGCEGLTVERVFCSGEVLPPRLRQRFHERVRGALYNLYGPTEAAVDVTHWEAGADDASDPIPIGHPVWNTRLYVLDEALRPLPTSVVGDLYIAGRQLAREYLRRPDLTNERFIADPFSEDGERMYRTGDRAYRRPDGALVFVGREDGQVKVRGQRVELGEIENTLRSVAGVADAAVALREDRPGGALVAYVVGGGSAPRNLADSVRGELRRRLPEVMVPADLVVLPALPLTASGKLDRSALPRPRRSAAAGGAAPSSEMEYLVAEIFVELLELDDTPPVEADFFSLGGNSLSAIDFAAGIAARTGVQPGPGLLFAHPTVGRLAARLDELVGGDGPHIDTSAEGRGGLDPLIALTEGSPGSAEAPLYCIHPAGGIAWCYTALARSLQPARPVLGLQARGLDAASPLPDSLQAMARDYVDEVLDVHPGGPVHLAGWSLGGIVAHAMAIELHERGAQVGAVALLDAYPSDRWREESDVAEGDALRALLLIAGEDPDALPEATLTRDVLRERLRRRGHLLGELSDDGLDAVVRVVASNNRLVRGHFHDRYPGELLHFRAALDHQGEGLRAALWAPYAARVDAYDIPVLHPQMTGPAAIGRIGPVISRYARATETSTDASAAARADGQTVHS